MKESPCMEFRSFFSFKWEHTRSFILDMWHGPKSASVSVRFCFLELIDCTWLKFLLELFFFGLVNAEIVRKSFVRLILKYAFSFCIYAKIVTLKSACIQVNWNWKKKTILNTICLKKANRNYWTLDARVRRWTLAAGLWPLDSGRWTLDAGLWTLDAGPWAPHFGHWALDTGYCHCLFQNRIRTQFLILLD